MQIVLTSPVNLQKLEQEITVINLPGFDGLVQAGNNLTVFCDELTSEQEEALNTVVENHTVPSVIPDVTPRQIRQALILNGVSLQDIDTALNSLSEPTKSLAKVEWEYSNTFQRDRPLVAQVGQMLGWTNQQLDDLWLYAATL